MKRLVKSLSVIVALCLALTMTAWAAAPGSYSDGTNTLELAEDGSFVMHKGGENSDGASFDLTVTGTVAEDGSVSIDGLYDGDISLIDVASEDQLAADKATAEELLAAGGAAEEAASEGGEGESAEEAASEGGEGESAEEAASEGGEGAGGGAGGPSMAFVSDGMTAAVSSIYNVNVDEEGNESETYSLTGYNRSVTMEDGTVKQFDKDSLYIGYAIVDGEFVEEDSNFDTSAIEKVDGAYQFDPFDIVIGDKFTEIYLKGEGSVADLTGEIVFESQMEEGQSGLPYYDEDGTLITANSDMSAAGAAIVLTNGGTAYVHDFSFTSNGFAHSLAVAWGDGEHSTILDIRDSEITTLGADPVYMTPDGFMAGGLDFNTMICPPWVLGLFGGTRTINILSNKATLTGINTTFASTGWAILSSDSCSDPVFNIVDSTLLAVTSDEAYGLSCPGYVDGGFDILGYDGFEVDGVHYDYGVAYGTYAIGSSREFLYGVDVLGTTYATISTGSAYTKYYSSEGTISLFDAIDYDEESDSFTKAYDEVEGQGKNSRIYSVFGFMSHGDGDFELYDGTEVHTEDAIFLYRNGNVKYVADDAVLDSKNGVILQMMDNDDAQAGGPVAQELIDMAGLPTQIYQSEEGDSNGGSYVCEVVLANGEYEGDLLNATGWYHSDTWGQDADTMDLTIDNATLTGAVSNSKLVHAVPYHEGIEEEIAAKNAANEQMGYNDIEYVYLNEALEVVEDAADAAYVQFTYFTKMQYYLLGHVINQLSPDGISIVNVTLKNGAVWNVTEECYVNFIDCDETSVINGEVSEAGGFFVVSPLGDAEEAASEGGESEGESAEEAASEGESAEEAAPEGGADTSIEAYHAYMYAWLDNECANNDSMTEDQLPEFQACIDADDYETFPGDMFFGGMLNTGVPMTYDEFVAAGGVYTIG